MYWWVNHKQTHKEEIGGGYIWSPKKNTNGAKNNSYDNMPKTSVGDIVFSFANAEIKAVGTVVEPCLSSGKPDEFGSKGDYWDHEGWLVKIKWDMLERPFRAKKHISQIAPLLPEKYSPIQQNGNGNQSCYLASITLELANVLLDISGYTKQEDYLGFDEDIEGQENRIAEQLGSENTISETEKEQLVKARRGQGKFRQNLELIESSCRVTGLSDKRFLIASHSKPWRVSTNQEKLDGNNGLLLSPHIDKLFDKGWISFTDEGDLLVSEEYVKAILSSWGVAYPLNVGKFNANQRIYLTYHREHIFKL
ncbi:HNH endonuclease [Vibrio splendidus]|uniref:HNH endonuclease n=1 Tax=Vibrio splendidus TaxID=29497 RepID=UPI000D39FDE5|nr:HNH endonuclease [Vibrio splendidus]PTP78645.1 HNH endonuclease [Vibrio splendidus]